MEDVADIYSLPGYTQFNDPYERAAKSYENDNGVYYYDEHNHYLFADLKPQTQEASPFWKGLAGVVNRFYRVLETIQTKLHLDKLRPFA